MAMFARPYTPSTTHSIGGEGQRPDYNKYSYMPNHRLHHVSIFGTVLAKRLLVSLNRITTKNVRVENKKGLICTEPRSLAGSYSAKKYQQYSRIATWILQQVCFVLSRGRISRIQVGCSRHCLHDVAKNDEH